MKYNPFSLPFHHFLRWVSGDENKNKKFTCGHGLEIKPIFIPLIYAIFF